METSSLPFSLESVTFSDGTTHRFSPSDIVVLVGPNNAGKSQALRELHQHLSGNTNGTVVPSAKMLDEILPEDFLSFIKDNVDVEQRPNRRYRYSGYRLDFTTRVPVTNLWPGERTHIIPFRSEVSMKELVEV